MKQLVILGAGTAGTMMANKLARTLPRAEWQITLVDRDDVHLYQPGLLFIPFGMYREQEIQRPRSSFIPREVGFAIGELERIDAAAQRVYLQDGSNLGYDLLIIATGARIMPEAVEGMMGPGWRRNTFDFYSLDGASALRSFLADWQGGRLVLNVAEMPIKCPVAPLEFLLLADAFFAERGMRDKVEIVYATPLDGAFTKPKASAKLGTLLAERNIKVETEFSVSRVDGEAKRIAAWDGRELSYDLLVTIPPHNGSAVIQTSGLGDDAGFLPTDKHTLQSKAHANIFALGDATNLPASKAGSVAHFQAEVLIDNVLRFVEGRPLKADFDGHANCFIESGHGKAILIDFNYDTEPLPGKFPLPGLGPFTLLAESEANHWGKLAFRWIYWHLLLKGEEIPIDHRMLMAGKWS